MVPKNGWPVPNSALTFKPANPNSPTVDAFDCGDEWFEKEVTQTVHGRKWASRDAWAYEFFLKGKSVGFVFMVNMKDATPWWDSPDEGYVRYIHTAGINRRFRKMPDPHRDAEVTVAESMFRSLENLPR